MRYRGASRTCIESLYFMSQLELKRFRTERRVIKLFRWFFQCCRSLPTVLHVVAWRKSIRGASLDF